MQSFRQTSSYLQTVVISHELQQKIILNQAALSYMQALYEPRYGTIDFLYALIEEDEGFEKLHGLEKQDYIVKEMREMLNCMGALPADFDRRISRQTRFSAKDTSEQRKEKERDMMENFLRGMDCIVDEYAHEDTDYGDEYFDRHYQLLAVA